MIKDHAYWEGVTAKALQSRTENNEIDFKEDLSEDQDRFKEHINAFGNEDGGIFVFGVKKDFTIPKNRSDFDAIAKRVADIAKDTQVPPLRVEIHTFHKGSQMLLGIHILPGERKPVFIKDRSPWGGSACFRRSGSNTVAMSEAEIRDRLSQSSISSYDETLVQDATFGELDLEKIEATIPSFLVKQGENEGNLNVLVDHQILARNSGGYGITLAGWLIFSKNPQSIRQLRNSSIEFQQFRGTTRDEPIKKLEITGTLPQQIEGAISTLLQHMWVIPKIAGIKRQDIPSYDQETLREVVANCVVHRDYRRMHQPAKIAMFSDRIEIENPGGLLPGLTPMNLIHKRDWRNPILARLMEKLGLGEMDGQGIDRIYAGTRRIKVPAPILTDSGHAFKVTLSAPKQFDHFSPEEKRLTTLILLILEQTIDNESVRNAFGIDRSKASTLLKSLVEDTVIESTGGSKKFAKYRLTPSYRQQIFG